MASLVNINNHLQLGYAMGDGDSSWMIWLGELERQIRPLLLCSIDEEQGIYCLEDVALMSGWKWNGERLFAWIRPTVLCETLRWWLSQNNTVKWEVGDDCIALVLVGEDQDVASALIFSGGERDGIGRYLFRLAPPPVVHGGKNGEGVGV